ncbi:MAG: M1 family metallopeptidase, partial [Calditrichia bacterium]|nr:M1 family metallopeptidase [Calditrichia bacterium]
MKRQQILVILFLFSSLLFSQTDDPYRLNHKVEPVYQLIHLNLDPDKEDYSGHTSIELEISENLTSFRLHGKEFEITEIELHQNNISIPVEYEFLEYGFLKIISKDELSAGKYKLSFSFKGQYDKKGQGIIKYTKDSLDYIYTHMEPIHARRFFPCFDEPNFKFTYQIEITASRDYLVVNNTPEEKETVKDNNKTILFKKTKPTPSYLLAFAVGPYETMPIPGLSIPGRIILSKGYLDKSLYIKNHTAKILKSLEDYFGSSYPYKKLDFIGIGMPAGAMENPGLVVFGDSYLIDSESLSLRRKRYRIMVTAHELAHMWFGNLVSLKWWNDNWLKEGFADWLAHEIILSDFPEVDPMGAISNNINIALRDDSKATTEPIQRDLKGNDNPNEVFDALSYDKSQIVLRMVENWIGRETFQKAMKTYFEKYKWKNTNAEDLFEILQEISGKDVTQVMQDFVMQAGVPIIEVRQIDSNTITLSQQRYKSVENVNNYKTIWHIPIALKLYDGNDVHEKYLYLDQHAKDFSFPELDKIEWVHLKNNLLGYYLQILPMDLFKPAIQSVELSLYEKKDLYTGLKYGYLAGQTNPSEILDLAYAVRNTSDEAIIEATIDRVADIFSTFEEDLDKNNSNFFLNHTLLPFLEKFGYDYSLEESSDKSNARSALFGTLKDNDQVRNRVVEIATQYLTNDVLISYSNYIYLVFLFYYEGTTSIYEKLRHRINKTKDPSERNVLFWTLGWFKNDTLV